MLLFLVVEVRSMWILPEQNNTAPVHLTMPRIRYLDPPAPAGYWDAAVIEGEWKFVVDKHTPENLTGCVVLYDLKNGETQEDATFWFKDRGIVALTTMFRANSNYPGAGNWVRSNRKTEHSFPVFEITTKQNESMSGWYKNQSHGIKVLITFDKNPWDRTFSTALPIDGIIILIFAGVTAILAAWKLTLLILRNGFQLSMAQVTLAINIFGGLLRMTFGAIDPFGASGTTNFAFSQIFLTLSFPSAISGALLISLYWHEMIKRTGNKINMFLDRLRWVFLMITLLMHIFELAIATLRGYHYSYMLLIFLDGAMYLVFSLAVFIFFVVTKYRLQKIFDKINAGLGSRKEQRLSLATFHLQAMVGTMVCFLVILILIGTTNIVWTPTAFPIMWIILFISVQLIGLFQVLLITAPHVPLKVFFVGCFRPEELRAHLYYDTSVPSGTSRTGSIRSHVGERGSYSLGSGSHEMNSSSIQ